MTIPELTFELIKQTGYDNSEKYELIILLWKNIVENQDWGYGCNEKIEIQLHEYINKLKNLIQN